MPLYQMDGGRWSIFKGPLSLATHKAREFKLQEIRTLHRETWPDSPGLCSRWDGWVDSIDVSAAVHLRTWRGVVSCQIGSHCEVEASMGSDNEA